MLQDRSGCSDEIEAAASAWVYCSKTGKYCKLVGSVDATVAAVSEVANFSLVKKEQRTTLKALLFIRLVSGLAK